VENPGHASASSREYAEKMNGSKIGNYNAMNPLGRTALGGSGGMRRKSWQ
jgi:hypothetical protein